MVAVLGTVAMDPQPVAAERHDGEATAREPSLRLSLRQAHTAFELGRYGEAIAGFSRAYQLRRDPRLLYNLGLAHLKRYGTQGQRIDLVQARDLFRRFLLLVDPTGPAFASDRERLQQVRTFAEAHLRGLEPELAREGASGRRPSPTSAPAPLAIPAQPVPILRQRPLTHWILYGAALAIAAAAATTGGLALRAQNDGHRLAKAGDPVGANGRADRADGLAAATDVLIGLGCAAATVGVVVHLRVRRAETATRVAVTATGLRLSF